MPSRCDLCTLIVLLCIGVSITALPAFCQTARNALVTSPGILDTAQSYITSPPRASLRRRHAIVPVSRHATTPAYHCTIASTLGSVNAAATHNVDKHNAPKRILAAGSSLLGVSLNLAELELSEEQKRAIQDSRSFARLKLHELREARKIKVMQLRDMLFNPNSTDIQIRECGAELQHFQVSMNNVNLESLIQLRSILTSEQRAKLANLICGTAKTSSPP